MVHYHSHRRHHVWKNVGEEDEGLSPTLLLEFWTSLFTKRRRPKLVFLFLLSFLTCTSLLALTIFFASYPTFSIFYSSGEEYDGDPLCSSISYGTMCCDRSHNRSDICFMKGDVRTHSNSSSIILYDSTNQDMEDKQVFQHERIRPYPRKWEAHTRENVAELNLILKREYLEIDHSCDVVHDVPALFFSTGGYTGNLFHEFNDGIVPLYITSQHLKKKVVFVIVDYHDWWFTKYADILSVLSDYPPIDFTGDNRTHCFTETIVGLRFHGDLTIDPSLMEGNKSMRDFRSLLDQAYWPRIKGLIEDEQRNASLSAVVEEMPQVMLKKPRLVLISRNGSRAIMNEDSLVKLAQRVGFDVEVLVPTKTTELARVYRVLNTSDVMVGVHGAALTHFLYLKPGSVLIQVIPLGSEWASETYFEGPSKKYGLKYIGYKILPRESSLYDSYDENDPILQDPIRMSRKSWEFTKKIYLDAQDVRLDLMRFQKYLIHAYDYSILKNW